MLWLFVLFAERSVLWGAEFDFAEVSTLLEQDRPAAAAALLQPAADSGDARAQFTLALLHDIGAGVAIDFERSSSLLQQAAASDYGPAVHYLAWKYRVGFGLKSDAPEAGAAISRAAIVTPGELPVPKDWLRTGKNGFHPGFARALTWMMAARTEKDPVALANLAAISLGGPWGPPNAGAHVQWLKQAAEVGHGPSAERLFMYFTTGVFVAEDPRQAAIFLRKAADAGVTGAQFRLARALERGSKEAPADPAAAAGWYERAAAGGHVEAMVRLGRMLRDGEGLPADAKRAYLIFRDAAATGDAEALGDLGWMQEKGRGTPIDLAGARDSYEKALAGGNAWAGKALGQLHAGGRLGEPDYAAARTAFERGAGLGSSAAMTELAALYYDGRGVVKDRAEAFRWYERAAREGNAWAQNRVGWMLRNGDGIERDDEEAVSWFRLAIKNGETWGHANLAHHLARGLGIEYDASEAAGHFLAAFESHNDAWTMREFTNFLGGVVGTDQDAVRAVLEAALDAPVSAAAGARESILLWTLFSGPDFLRDAERGAARLRESGRDATALLDMANQFYLGSGALLSWEAARACGRMAASAQPVKASLMLARIDLYSDEPELRQQGRAILERLGEAGDTSALDELGHCHATGLALQQDLDLAWECVERLAAAGSAAAKLALQRPEADRRAALVMVFGNIGAELPDESELLEQARTLSMDASGNRPIKVLHRPPPVFPRNFKQVSGKAMVRFVVPAVGGFPRDVVATEASHPVVARVAEANVNRWYFAPQIKNGEPVDTSMVQPFVIESRN